jgi:hypothetical protein
MRAAMRLRRRRPLSGRALHARGAACTRAEFARVCLCVGGCACYGLMRLPWRREACACCVPLPGMGCCARAARCAHSDWSIFAGGVSDRGVCYVDCARAGQPPDPEHPARWAAAAAHVMRAGWGAHLPCWPPCLGLTRARHTSSTPIDVIQAHVLVRAQCRRMCAGSCARARCASAPARRCCRRGGGCVSHLWRGSARRRRCGSWSASARCYATTRKTAHAVAAGAAAAR